MIPPSLLLPAGAELLLILALQEKSAVLDSAGTSISRLIKSILCLCVWLCVFNRFTLYLSGCLLMESVKVIFSLLAFPSCLSAFVLCLLSRSTWVFFTSCWETSFSSYPSPLWYLLEKYSDPSEMCPRVSVKVSESVWSGPKKEWDVSLIEPL